MEENNKNSVLRHAGIRLLIGALVMILATVLTGCGGNAEIGSIGTGDPTGGSGGSSGSGAESGGSDAGVAVDAHSDGGIADATVPDAPAADARTQDGGFDAGDALLVVRRVDPVVPRYEPLGRKFVSLAEYGLLNRGVSPMRVRTLRASMPVQESTTALESLYLMYRPSLDSKVGRASVPVPLSANGSPFPVYDLNAFQNCDPVFGRECTEIPPGEEAFFTLAADVAITDEGVDLYADPKTFEPLLGDCAGATCSIVADNADGVVPADRVFVIPSGIATGILGDPTTIIRKRLFAGMVADAPIGPMLPAQQSVVTKFVVSSADVGDANATFSLRAIGLDIQSSNMGVVQGAQVYRTSVAPGNLVGEATGAPKTVDSGSSTWMGYWVPTPTFGIGGGIEMSPGVAETFIVTMKTSGMLPGDTLTVGLHSVDWATTSSWVWTDVCYSTPIAGNTLVF